VLPGVLGTLQATEAIKLISGVGEPLIGRLLTYDALDMRFSEFRVTRRRDCAVCGDAPTITEPLDMPKNAEGTEGIRRLSVAALHERLERGERPLLVDVREDPEFAAGHLDGALHIPLGQLAQRLAEIDPASEPVFICRSGGRSMAACQMALRANIRSPANLEGGMMAWAATIDPRVKVV
jgi:sulfur-carrier protein adenylyltransferase/sulfurtransferase